MGTALARLAPSCVFDLSQIISIVSFPASEIDARLKDVGLLLGLLTAEPNDELSVNFDWFSDPIPYLKNIPKDRDDLLNLLRDLLGDPISDSPEGNAWYQVNWQGKPTPVHVVLPKDNSGATSVIAAGMLHSFTSDTAPVQIEAWTTAPLVALQQGETPIIAMGKDTYPIVTALDVKSNDPIKAGTDTFKGLEFQGNILFDADPSFELLLLDVTPTTKQSTWNSLKDVLAALETLSNWLNPLLATATVKARLATKIKSTDVLIGTIFVDMGLLIAPAAPGDPFTFGGFDKLQTLLGSPTACAEFLLAEGLKVIASREAPIVPLGEGGIYVVSQEAGKGAIDYGLRLTVPDIVLGKKAEASEKSEKTDAASKSGDETSAKPDGDKAKKPNQLVLQLGKFLTGESKDNNWLKRADPKGTHSAPGLNLYLIRETGTVPSFQPKVELVSLGLDYSGAEKTPLVAVKGFSLGGVEPRIYVSIDFDDTSNIAWGGAIRADHLGLPVGNVTGATGNPVAQNLLSSGSSKKTPAADDKSDGADKQAVAPEFSAAIAFAHDPVNKTVPNFQLFDAKDKPSDKVTLPIQRKFGPLFLNTLGLGWAQPNPDLDLDVIFNGSVKLSSLEVTLKDLSVGIPLRTPGDISAYSLGLEGIDFELKAGSVEIAGGLFKDDVTVNGEKIAEYNGTALVKVGTAFSMTAMGSWASVEGHPSLFVFALVDIPLGGPAFFFVTGLSGGFGYNRALKVPAQDKVQDFPLVAGISNPDAVGGKNASPTAALAAIKEYIPPAQGVNFIAAGVQFTTFEVITSNALVIIEFGKDFEVVILGLSRLKLPQTGAEQFVYIELGLRVIFVPAQGEILATLALTPNSYVLTPDCKLTGGFAFAIWFDPSPHAGDFVVTAGGYSTYFKKPEWYPNEPRLGFNWKVSDQVTISGTSYFAMTPSVAMGGGALDIQFHAGPIRAWFTAHADFMIQWKPFHFEATIGVSIGISVTLRMLFVKVTLKLEVGASIDMWGPPLGGLATIEMWFASIRIGFGADRQTQPDFISFTSFADLLPQDSKAAPVATQSLSAAVNDDASVPFNNVLKMVATKGQLPVQAPDGRWLVRGNAFRLDVQTVWPVLDLHVSTGTADTVIPAPTLDPVQTDGVPPCATAGTRSDGYFVGVRPMGVECAASDLTVSIMRGAVAMNVADDWLITPTLTAVPEALWGAPIPAGQKPTPGAKTLSNRMMGLTGLGAKKHPKTGPDAMPAEVLAKDALNPMAAQNNLLPIPQAAPTNLPTQDSGALGTIATSVASATVATKRSAIFAALGAAGVNARTNGGMQPYVDQISTNFAGQPMMGHVA